MITITKKNISFFLIYSLPIIFLIIFIAIFGVNFPFMDEWALVDIVEKTTSNTITFQDFFAQHNEHRIFFPRLIFIVFLLIFGWNTKYMMYFSVFLAILSFFYLYKIATYKHKIKSPVGLNHLPNILMCFLLFSLIQQENWLWGFQIAWFLVNLCLIIGT